MEIIIRESKKVREGRYPWPFLFIYSSFFQKESDAFCSTLLAASRRQYCFGSAASKVPRNLSWLPVCCWSTTTPRDCRFRRQPWLWLTVFRVWFVQPSLRLGPWACCVLSVARKIPGMPIIATTAVTDWDPLAVPSTIAICPYCLAISPSCLTENGAKKAMLPISQHYFLRTVIFVERRFCIFSSKKRNIKKTIVTRSDFAATCTLQLRWRNEKWKQKQQQQWAYVYGRSKPCTLLRSW